VAILGSVFSAGYANRMGPAVASLPAGAADAARESLVGAAAVAGQLAGTAGSALLDAARTAFVGAMGTTSLIGVGFAVLGAIVALVFLPDRAAAPRAAAPVEPSTSTIDARLEPSEAM
jgi:DHA2 family multidrug resistance protein-like MFS transporter